MASVNISPPGDRSLKELVSDLRHNTGLLVRQEIALAKAELKQKVAGVAKTAVTFGAAGLLAFAGLLAILATVALTLVALGVVAWLATLIVAVVVLAGALVLVQRARRPQPKQDSGAT
jgi:uncharacterized membrane protein